MMPVAVFSFRIRKYCNKCMACWKHQSIMYCVTRTLLGVCLILSGILVVRHFCNEFSDNCCWLCHFCNLNALGLVRSL
jgi:hypothetical protein